MRKSKKVFLLLSGIFIIIVVLIGFDISRRTSFPGSKKLLKESINPSDTLESSSQEKEIISK